MIGLSEHFDYKKLIKFTLPTIVMMIFTSIYGVVDGIFISNIVGSEAFAGVNLIMPAVMILGAIGFMIGTGGSALVSKTIGEGKKEQANKYFSMLIYVVLIAGVILALLSFIFIRPISILIGAEGDLIDICVTYGRVLLVTMPAFLLQNCFQSFLVVAEKPKMGLVISVIAGITNMILDFLFMYVFGMGVFGAALATGISQVVGGVVPFLFFIRKNDTSLRLVKTKFELRPILNACVNGSSEMVTNISMSLVNVLFNLQLMKYAGANGVVAYGIIMYVGFIFSGTYLGYSVGSSPIVSYHYGAGNKEELKNLFKKSLKLLLVTSIIMTLFAEVLSKPLASIFVGYDKELLDMTTTAIRLYATSYIICWFNIYASAFFTALNDGFISALISFLRTFGFQIIMIFVLPLIWGLNGLWLSVTVAEMLSFIVSIICLVLKKNKYQYV